MERRTGRKFHHLAHHHRFRRKVHKAPPRHRRTVQIRRKPVEASELEGHAVVETLRRCPDQQVMHKVPPRPRPIETRKPEDDPVGEAGGHRREVIEDMQPPFRGHFTIAIEMVPKAACAARGAALRAAWVTRSVIAGLRSGCRGRRPAIPGRVDHACRAWRVRARPGRIDDRPDAACPPTARLSGKRPFGSRSRSAREVA